jgi:hypothetical protein
MALISVTVASPGDEIRETEEVARPAGGFGAIHIELPGRAMISVERVLIHLWYVRSSRVCASEDP